jgi:hypothetical protein
MKKTTLINAFSKVAFVVVALVAIAMLLDYATAAISLGIGSGISGLLLGVTAIPGGTVTEKNYVDNAEELLERDVDDLVVMYKPDRFPLTTMMQNMKKAKKAAARKYEWVDIGYHARITTTTSAVTLGTNGDAVAVPVADLSIWNVGDIVYIPTVTVGSPAEEARLIVVEKLGGSTSISCKALNDANVPAIPDATTVYRMSRAAAAKDAQTGAHGAQGITQWNYCQTFMGQFEIEKIIRAISVYQDDYSVQQDLEMYDFRNGRENSRLFGTRSKVFDPVKGEDVYTMSGQEKYIGEAADYTQGSIDNNEWIDLTEKAFAANAGSEKRLLIGGKKFISSVLKVPNVQKQLEGKQTKLVLGVHVNEISTNFGVFYLKHHKGFDEMGRQHDAFSLDMNHICDRILEPMQETELELDKTGQKRVDATRVLETATLQSRYPDTHMIIKGLEP